MSLTPIISQNRFDLRSGGSVQHEKLDFAVLDNGLYAVAYIEIDGSGNRDARIALFDAQGNLIQDNSVSNIANAGDAISIEATENGKFIILYETINQSGSGTPFAFIRVEYDSNFENPLNFSNKNFVGVVGTTINYEDFDLAYHDGQIFGATDTEGPNNSVTLSNFQFGPALFTDNSADDIRLANIDDDFQVIVFEAKNSFTFNGVTINTIDVKAVVYLDGGLAAEFVIDSFAGTTVGNPDVAGKFGGDGFAVAFDDGQNVYFAAYNLDGTFATDGNNTPGIQTISTSAGTQKDARITSIGQNAFEDGYYVIWIDTTNNTLSGQRLNSLGEKIGDEQIIVAGGNNFSVVDYTIETLSDGRIIISWTEFDGSTTEIKQSILDPRANEAGDQAFVSGDDGDDVLTAVKGVDTTIFGDGVLSVDPGDDVIFGDTGNDTIAGQGGNDNIHGGFGEDIIYGGEGNDTLNGGLRSDEVYGEAGDDTIIYDDPATFSTDILDGGTGNDTLVVNNVSGAITVDISSGGVGLVDTNVNSGNLASLIDFENVITNSAEIIIGSDQDNILTSTEEDIDFFNNGENIIFGLDGNDTINAGDGDDVLNGGAGADILNGGNGIDAADYRSSSEGVTVFTSGRGGRGGDGQGDKLDGIENIIGSAHQDQIVLNAATAVDNTVNAGDGDDRIRERDGGTNVLNGEDGDDNIFGGTENDTLNGGNDEDNLFGGGGNDTINGGDDAARDTLFGSSGDDILNGGGGNDALRGNTGMDTLNGGDGTDNLQGGNQNDILNGDAGVDTLDGGSGNDILNGGTGNDRLTGGGSNDIFIFEDGSGIDRITDFNFGSGDQIDLTDFNLADFDAVMALATEVNGDVRIQLDGDDRLILEGTTLASLDADDFIL